MRWTEVVEALEERGLSDDVAEVVQSYGVTMSEACSRCRTTQVVRARHAAWDYLRRLGYSTTEVGRLWGVDHSTVCTARKKD